MCVGHKDKQIRQDRIDRDLLYHTIKGYADPKKFTITKERLWPIDGDSAIQIIMPTQDELILYDQRFRMKGNNRWQK